VFLFYLNERPEFQSRNGDGLHLLDKGVMNHLRFLTSISDKLDDSAISPSTNSCHSPQATPLTMRLENLVYLFWLKLTAVVDCVKGVRKGLLAGRAEVTLTTLTCNTRVYEFNDDYRVSRA